MAMTVGFLGLGSMGRPMAVNLAAAGFPLRVWNRTRGKGAGIANAVEVATPREAAQGADVVLSMLADDVAVEAVALGPDGLVHGLAKGAVHTGCSTISPQLARRLAAAHAAQGQRYASAPVFGRPDAAQAKQLFVVPGGDAAAVERCGPVFAALGTVGAPLPAPEQANLVKLVGNFFIASMIEMLGEGLSLAEKAGMDPAALMEIINATRMGSPILKGYGAQVASTGYEKAGFALPLGLKDVTLALEAARGLHVPMPLASLLRDHLIAALARGREKWDWSGLTSIVRENAGLPALR